MAQQQQPYVYQQPQQTVMYVDQNGNPIQVQQPQQQQQQVVYVDQYGNPIQTQQQPQQQKVVYIQQPQQIQPNNNNKDNNKNANPKPKGFIGSIFGNSLKHIQDEAKPLQKDIEKFEKQMANSNAQKMVDKQINNVANAFNKEVNGAAQSLFGLKKKKKPQQKGISIMKIYNAKLRIFILDQYHNYK